MEAYSVLMSVYHRSNPDYFDLALQSMLEQTVPTDDFVLVCDGPLTLALDAVVEKYHRRYPQVLQVLRLPENVGVGEAANAGLARCKHDLVAKMDADDIAVPQRCQWQLERFAQRPQLVALGGFISEFDQDPEHPTTIREVPLENPEIRRFARRRQPFNNTTIMYRRSVVQRVGGYRKMNRCEDFDLYIRLLCADAYCENLEQVLVQVRVDRDALARRGSMETLRGCADSRWRSFRLGYASLLDVCVCVGGELLIMICPPGLKRWIYRRLLRKETN